MESDSIPRKDFLISHDLKNNNSYNIDEKFMLTTLALRSGRYNVQHATVLTKASNNL